MRTSEAKYQLWQIMLAIAVLAGMFAVFGVAAAVGVVMVIAVMTLPILLAARGRRLRAAVWITSLYPFLILSSFYVTWLTAWCILGHRPRVSLDDPEYISPIVNVVGATTGFFMLGTPLVWFVCAPIMLGVAYWNMAQKKTPVEKGIWQLLIPVFAWVLSIKIFLADPGWVIAWYFD
jgi:hypothetical protein